VAGVIRCSAVFLEYQDIVRSEYFSPTAHIIAFIIGFLIHVDLLSTVLPASFGKAASLAMIESLIWVIIALLSVAGISGLLPCGRCWHDRLQ
jgi:hypothetical protein